MRKLFSTLLLATLITTPVILPSPALSEIRRERGQFKAGTEGTTIQVGLIRNEPHNNEVANYRLKIYITGDDLRADAKVPGTNYHATGDVTCSMGDGKPAGSCPFGVTRRGNGSADVTVTKPDGRSRVIFFENGQAIGADTSQADPGEFSASKEGDIYIIRIGNERYEIFEAIIFGG
jgi:hypothetical protein